MRRQQCKTSRITKKQVNITLPRRHNYFPVTDHKEMEIYEFSDQKNFFFQNNCFKEAHQAIRENRQLKEIRKT